MKDTFTFSNIRDRCIDFLKNEEIKKDVKDMISPIMDMIYNEVYVYILFICLYHVFLFLIILANLYLLVKLLHLCDKQPYYTFAQ
jgi:hypothetical protein